MRRRPFRLLPMSAAVPASTASPPRRPISAIVTVLLCAALLPSSALAAKPRTATGTVTAVEPSSLTIQTAGRRTGMINALSDAANAVTKADYPYVWGGGHGAAGDASIGIKGPGYNGRRVGYDCSGSVAAVLAGAGLWQAGSPVPNDAGVIRQLLQEKLIARGPGTAPDEVTLYDDPGVHIFMNIDGRFFGTSDGGSGNPSQQKGGASWLYDGAPDASDRAFKRYHVLPSVLKDQTTYGHSFTFEIAPNDSIEAGVAVGDDLRVTYQQTGFGGMLASTIGYVGALTTSGTVTSIAPDGSSFTITGANGQSDAFSTGTNPGLVSGLQVGDTAEVTYTKGSGAILTARVLTVTATPVVAQATGSIVAIAADLSSFVLETSSGQDVTFSTGGVTSTLAGFEVGEGVQVNYIEASGGALIAQLVTAASSGTTGSGGSGYGGGYGGGGPGGGGAGGGGYGGSFHTARH